MDDVLDSLFIKREEEINLSKEQQEKILEEPKIYLHNILEMIENVEIKELLIRYEDQQNKLNAIYDELFYKQGFYDSQNLK